MKKYKLLLLSGIVITALITNVEAANRPKNAEATIPLINSRHAPKIDGEVHEAEWSNALRVDGLIKKNHTLDNRRATFWLTSDGNKVYIAMRSALPPGDKILNRVKKLKDSTRDQSIVSRDDTLELWIDPHSGQTSGDQRYFQIVTNANGALYDVAYNPANPAQTKNMSWRVDWDYASSIKDGRWNVEIAIPLKSLGATPKDLNHSWGVRIVRNWKNPSAQAAWSARGGAFSNRQTMAQVTWQKQSPLIRMLSLRPKDNTGTNLKLQLLNRSTKEQEVKLKVTYNSANNQRQIKNKTYRLTPGKSQVFELYDQTREGMANATILATSPSYNKVYFYRNIQWQLNPPKQLWTVLESAAKTISFKFGFYPSYHRIKAKLNIDGLKQASNVTGATLEVLDKNSNKVLAHTKFPDFKDNQSYVIMDLPKLEEGKYKVSAALKGKNVPTKPITKQFVRQKFKWENNNIGISNEVIPPFTPLKVKGNIVEAVLRKHTMNNQGVWSQVVSKGKKVLASPMHFEVKVDGKTKKIEAQSLKFTEKQPNKVKAVAQWQAGPINAHIKEFYDYDGMIKIKMHLDEQGNKPIQKLDLVIPIKAKIAKLMHVISDGGLRFQYSGKVPTGHGIIWESKNANHPSSSGTFAPYIWIGNEEQGIAWFADNNKGWLLNFKNSTHTIERLKDGTTVLRVHFVTKSGALKHPRDIVFGLQATPTKPMPNKPKPWRDWQFYGHSNDIMSIAILGSAYRWGAYTSFFSVYPREKDYSIYSIFRKARQTGKANYKAIDKWLSGYDYSKTSHLKKKYAREVKFGERQMAGQPDVALPYTNARSVNYGPEFQTFQDEWLVNNYTSRHWPSSVSGGMGYSANQSKSYQDYKLWYYKKMLESGAFDGIYFDNIFPQVDMNSISGSTWRDDKGKLHPGYDIFAMRKFLKRVAILVYNQRHAMLNMAHMTNTQIVPVTTWCGMNLDWEMHYGMSDFQDRFSRPWIRTESIGRQSGSVPVVLGGIRGKATAKRKKFVERTRVALTVVHEIKVWTGQTKIGHKIRNMLKDFGYGKPECKVFDYWEKPFPAKLEGTDAKMLILNKDGKALIFVASFGKTADCTIKLDANKLNLKTNGSFVNLEAGEKLNKVDDFGVRFSLPHHDFRVIEYK